MSELRGRWLLCQLMPSVRRASQSKKALYLLVEWGPCTHVHHSKYRYYPIEEKQVLDLVQFSFWRRETNGQTNKYKMLVMIRDKKNKGAKEPSLLTPK